jgi:SAM-dependent methyltransferase
MDSADYAIKIFNLHMKRAFSPGLPLGSAVLELGPSDSIASALLRFATGSQRTYLVDAGSFAQKDVAFYRFLVDEMAKKAFHVPEIMAAKSFYDVLEACNAQYMTEGISSLRTIPSESVDFVWSHSVLEHVRKHELGALLSELYCILKPGAVYSHNIDYQDHLDFELNNLRFSGKLWESPFFVKSGFYSNLIPALKMHALFREVGFEIIQEAFGKWLVLPAHRSSMHQDFQVFRDNELLNRISHVLFKA